MLERVKKYKKEILAASLVVAAFVVVSFLSERYLLEWAARYRIDGWEGQAIYILLMSAAVIVAPFETLPLIPVATRLWGPGTAAFLTIIGWTLGSLTAFGLARALGHNLLASSLSRFRRLENSRGVLTGKHLFWLVAFARFVLPLDVVSYAAGLFTSMSWFSYTAATLMGIVPFSFLFAYGAGLPWQIQAAGGVMLLLVIAWVYPRLRRWQKEQLGKQPKNSGFKF